MRALDQMQVREALLERIRAGVPFLGICLGLQALFESSEEAPQERGLGLFPGEIRRFPATARVPHMGWNEIEPPKRREASEESGAASLSLFRAQLLRAIERCDGRDVPVQRSLYGRA